VNDADRFRLLFGPYRMPRCRVGRKLFCEVRGWVTVRGLSDNPIPWPQTRGKRGRPFLILCGDLVKAVRRESNQAVAYHWGVTPQTVSGWRKALDVGPTTEGTSRLRSDYTREPWAEAARAKGQAKNTDPARRAKLSAAKRGKARPAHVTEALRAARLGEPLPAETRRKMSAAHKRRGTRPPKAGSPWTPEEDELVRTLPPVEVAERTGRSLAAVYDRRRVLRLPDGRAERWQRDERRVGAPSTAPSRRPSARRASPSG
jgi:hypothetical protein